MGIEVVAAIFFMLTCSLAWNSFDMYFLVLVYNSVLDIFVAVQCS